MTKAATIVLGLSVLLCSGPALAEQPVFGEMPRWAGGWGVQTQHEARRDGDQDSQWLHVDGVYTWERWIRVTAKVPFRLEGEPGLGTPTLALPLKRYFNLDGRSGSWSITPQWFVPIATRSENARAESTKLSLSYETEAYRTHIGAAMGLVHRTDGLYALHVHGGTGINLHSTTSSGHIKLKARLRLRSDGAYSVRIGPTVYWRFSDRWHGQLAYKHAVLAEGYIPRYSLRTGVAVVY
jgi:hypothetical protein